MNRWQEIWSKRTVGIQERLGLEDLLRLDGFDTGAGTISLEVWRAYVNRRADELGLEPGASVFEVGCGAGAFSFPLYERGCSVSGVDYSPALVAAAQQAMPKGTWGVSPADGSIENTYTAVVSNSVFHYFPNEEYATKVLHSMLNAAETAVGIFDIPDTELAAAADVHRREALGEAEYVRRYVGLNHLTFTRDWFTDKVPAGWTIDAKSQDMPEYGNNQYRFNMVMKRHD